MERAPRSGPSHYSKGGVYAVSDDNAVGNSSSADTRGAAERYLRAGLSVIPVSVAEKNPYRGGWQNERWSIEDVPELWDNGQGIGVLWGKPSGGLIDVDLDWREARIAAG